MVRREYDNSLQVYAESIRRECRIRQLTVQVVPGSTLQIALCSLPSHGLQVNRIGTE